MTTHKEKVVVGMSGGVDSSISAYLLQKSGYDVYGLTFSVLKKQSSDSFEQARAVANILGISHEGTDLHERFSEKIIDYFKTEYLNGRTPNPCMICNAKFKWATLLSYAETVGAKYVATGHYATRAFKDGFYKISFGKDRSKDQSYMLWMLSQEALSKTLFPLSDYTKTEVRALARSLGFKNADRTDSFEICFIPDDDYAGYLKLNVPGLEESVKNGEIINRNGEVLGYHKGYPFYTVGQRRGLGISTPQPSYVTEIDAQKNQIIVGAKDDLLHRKLTALHPNWFFNPDHSQPLSCDAKIRYKDTPEPCVVTFLSDGSLEIEFETPKRAITPGQAIVFYKNNEMLGGAFIDNILM